MGDYEVYVVQLQYLDIFFLIKRLKVICDMFSYQGVEDGNILSKYFYVFLEKEGNSYVKILVVVIYWKFCQVWGEFDEFFFYYEFMELLEKYLFIFLLVE